MEMSPWATTPSLGQYRAHFSCRVRQRDGAKGGRERERERERERKRERDSRSMFSSPLISCHCSGCRAGGGSTGTTLIWERGGMLNHKTTGLSPVPLSKHPS